MHYMKKRLTGVFKGETIRKTQSCTDLMHGFKNVVFLSTPNCSEQTGLSRWVTFVPRTSDSCCFRQIPTYALLWNVSKFDFIFLFPRWPSQMNFDSEELFDSTFGDSVGEYIPKTSDDMSDDTDTSEVLESATQEDNMLRWMYFKKTNDIKDRCVPEIQVSSTTSKQVPNRGHWPARKGSKAFMTHKRQRLGSGSHPKTQTRSWSVWFTFHTCCV